MTTLIAIDGGATTTRAAAYDEAGTRVSEARSGPCNAVAWGVNPCVETIAALVREFLEDLPEAVALLACGISGARQPDLRDAIARALSATLRVERVIVTDDVYPLLLANAQRTAAVLTVAGTGSSVLAQDEDGRQAQVGGYGRVFGDDGSAYGIAISALRAAAGAVDELGPETALVEALPEVAGVASFEDLSVWAESRPKRDIAALAKTVTRLAEEGDGPAARCVADHARRLATQGLAAADWLALPSEAPVYMHGGVFEGSSLFSKIFELAVHEHRPLAPCQKTEIHGPDAVVALAKTQEIPDANVSCFQASKEDEQQEDKLPTTERPLNTTRPIDRMEAIDIVNRMNQEEDGVGAAIDKAAHAIAQVVESVAQAIQSGGRLIYIGAGTSGRLGVLDAAECPPTFGVSEQTVIGIVAGGETALRHSVEGAEDNPEAGAADLAAIRPAVGELDVVIGISASGTTPYVRAALDEARARHATSIMLCCNPACRCPADTVIVLDTGPEILTGSTRLKAGTATKRVLNMISTGAMARAGLLYEGLMVGMLPVNAKLRGRALRIISTLTGLDTTAASKVLDEAGNRIPVAVLMATKSIDAEEATYRLGRAEGVLRAALEEP